MTNDKKHGFHPEFYLPVPNELKQISGLLDSTHTGELAVYSMSAMDDITLKIPDALFNGAAVKDIIENCIPAITDAWKIPFSTLNYLLTAIRLASSGAELTLSIKCPKCDEENEYAVQLSIIMDSLSTLDSITNIEHVINGQPIKINLKSIQYKQLTEFNIAAFNNQKISQQVIQLSKNDESRLDHFSKLANDTNDLQTSWILSHIQNIEAGGNIVSDTQYVEEFLKGMDKLLFEKILKHIDEYNKKLTPQLDFDCSSCSFKFNTNFSLDYGNVFRGALLHKNSEEISELILQFESDIGRTKKDLLRSVWFMRGGVSYTEALKMSAKERRLINKIVDDNIKTTKESGMPFF